MSYTAHNIRFADGTFTMPGNGNVLADSPKCLSAKRVIALLYSGKVEGKRIADLGCLEGGFALEFARMGMDALGIEIRSNNFANCREVQERAGLPNLDFKQDDVWNVGKYAPFDVIFCSGILYHLDRPHEFLRLMGDVSRDAVIIDTHFAPWSGQSDFILSELQQHDGLIGRWYYEHNLEQSEALDALKWASWSNHRSFWPVKEALVQAIHDAGFELVFEQFDAAAGADLFGTLTSDAYRTLSRGEFVGIRSTR